MKHRLHLIIALVFAGVYAAFALSAPLIWNSPDETAVAYFSREFGERGRLWQQEPYNIFVDDLIHPRSIISVEAHLVPASFYGSMWVVGLFYRLIGTLSFAVVTPIFTALAAVAVFFLLRRHLGAGKAYLGEVLFLAHPAIWYFASRGLFPNLLFVDFALLGAATLALRPWQHVARGRASALGTFIDDAVGVMLIAVALVIRPSEFIWLGPLLAAWMYVGRRHLTLPRILAGTGVAALVLAAALITNASLYGSPATFGYTAGADAPGVAISALGADSVLPDVITAPRAYVLPFGFHPKTALINLWVYAIALQWWFAVAVIVGLFFFPIRPAKRLLVALFFVTTVLGIYYGSAVFSDSTIPGWTAGSSYLRYFLPITVLAIPFAAEGVWRIGVALGKKRPIRTLISLTAVIVLLNAWNVYFRSPDSLLPMRATLIRYTDIKKEVMNETTAADVIIVERSDKVFFPDRRVMLNLRDQTTLDAVPKLSVFARVYYFGITIADDEYPRIQDELGKRGFQMGRTKTFGNESLYAITPRQ